MSIFPGSLQLDWSLEPRAMLNPHIILYSHPPTPTPKFVGPVLKHKVEFHMNLSRKYSNLYWKTCLIFTLQVLFITTLELLLILLSRYKFHN